MMLATLPLTAQERVRPTLRVLPLGDPPPFVQEVRDGARYEVPPAAGAIPPRLVMIPLPARAGAPQQPGQSPLRLRLGRPSNPVVLADPEDSQVDLKLEQGSAWVTIPLHPCGSSLALVWRWGKTWKEARTLVLPDDPVARTEGNLHFVNLTAAPMGVVIGTERIRLDPGRTFSRHFAPGAPGVSVEILCPSPSGGVKSCYSTLLSASPGIFSRVFIYAADGHNPRLPVKVLRLDEPT